MARKLVQEILVPAEYGRAFRVDKGQTMRIIAIEGPQVGDLAAFNAHNYREFYDPTFSYVVNRRQGTGNANKIQYLYSRPPRMNTMLEITDDKVEQHWCLSGSRCNPRIYELRDIKGPVRSCQGNLAEAIRDFGMPPEDVPDVFNLFMNVEHSPDGLYETVPSLAKKGDYTDFLAHMDCLIALSACPATPISNLNDGVNKPLQVEIWEG